MKNGLHDNYYFYLESSVFLFRKKRKALLYDTRSGRGLLFSAVTGPLSSVVRTLNNPENMYSIPLTAKQLEDKGVADFVRRARAVFSGDLIPRHLALRKPVVMMPVLNFQIDPRKWAASSKESFLGENILDLVKEVTLFLDGKELKGADKGPDREFIFDLLTQLRNYRTLLHIHVRHLGDYEDFSLLLERIQGLSLSLCWQVDYIEFYEAMNRIPLEKTKVKLTVKPSFDPGKLKRIIQFCAEHHLQVSTEFRVENEADIESVERFLRFHPLENYTLNPHYNKNKRFFKKYVYVTERDLINTPVTKKQIFANQVINTYSFGKVYIKSNGDFFTSLHQPKLGNLCKHKMQELLIVEMEKGRAWFRTRTQKPCTDCVYQWICPSPSVHEWEIGKPNLCHVMP